MIVLGPDPSLNIFERIVIYRHLRLRLKAVQSTHPLGTIPWRKETRECLHVHAYSVQAAAFGARVGDFAAESSREPPVYSTQIPAFEAF